jgi:hypothetical protein
VNLLSRSRMRNRKPRLASSRSISRLRASWANQARMGGDAEDVHPTAGVLDDEERVEPVQGDRVEVKQVAGEDRLALRSEELCPGRSGPPRRGVDSGGVQDFPDGGDADLVAESGEFAVDAAVAPGGVLGGHAHDQGADTGGDGGATSASGLGGPAASDELPVPAQDRGRVTSNPTRRGAGSSRLRTSITARSAQLTRSRGVRRCSTVSWWRRTRISMSLAVSERMRSTNQSRSLAKHLVDQRQRHRWIMPGHLRSPVGRSTAEREVSGTHSLVSVGRPHRPRLPASRTRNRNGSAARPRHTHPFDRCRARWRTRRQRGGPGGWTAR